jgi:hypothetical protein
MIWAQLLGYVTGRVDQELLLRNEYLAAENRILKSPDQGSAVTLRRRKARMVKKLKRVEIA